jgi:hypothetical protein
LKVYNANRIKNSFFGRRKMNHDTFWEKSLAMTSFIYPWNPEAPPATIFRALHDKKYFYFRFDVIDTDILTEKGEKDKMAVLNSDRVEIFFRSDKDMNPYYGLEMDPAGRVLDYTAKFYRKFDYNWTWVGITVRSAYTLNGYRIWGSIPLESLREMSLLHDNTLQAGLFRGKCIRSSEGEVFFKWISWVQPDSDQPDFHIPSAFGEIRCSGD